MDSLTLLLLTLATYRISYMLALETGPFGLCERWRGWATARSRYRRWVMEGVSCPLCVSFWLSLPAGLVVARGWLVLMVWLGIAGGVLVLHKAVHRG